MEHSFRYGPYAAEHGPQLWQDRFERSLLWPQDAVLLSLLTGHPSAPATRDVSLLNTFARVLSLMPLQVASQPELYCTGQKGHMFCHRYHDEASPTAAFPARPPVGQQYNMLCMFGSLQPDRPELYHLDPTGDADDGDQEGEEGQRFSEYTKGLVTRRVKESGGRSRIYKALREEYPSLFLTVHCPLISRAHIEWALCCAPKLHRKHSVRPASSFRAKEKTTRSFPGLALHAGLSGACFETWMQEFDFLHKENNTIEQHRTSDMVQLISGLLLAAGGNSRGHIPWHQPVSQYREEPRKYANTHDEATWKETSVLEQCLDPGSSRYNFWRALSGDRHAIETVLLRILRGQEEGKRNEQRTLSQFISSGYRYCVPTEFLERALNATTTLEKDLAVVGTEHSSLYPSHVFLDREYECSNMDLIIRMRQEVDPALAKAAVEKILVLPDSSTMPTRCLLAHQSHLGWWKDSKPINPEDCSAMTFWVWEFEGAGTRTSTTTGSTPPRKVVVGKIPEAYWTRLCSVSSVNGRRTSNALRILEPLMQHWRRVGPEQRRAMIPDLLEGALRRDIPKIYLAMLFRFFFEPSCLRQLIAEVSAPLSADLQSRELREVLEWVQSNCPPEKVVRVSDWDSE